MRCFIFILLVFTANVSLYAQSDQLARNYLDQGEYEKALKTYEQLLKSSPYNSTFFFGMVTAYQQMEEFELVESLLLDRQKKSPNNPNIFIELGHNAQLQRDNDKANEYYQLALNELNETPTYTYSVARTFEKYNLLDHAAAAYMQGMKLSPEMKFDLPLARIYGEQGKFEEMFTSYLDLMDKEPELSYNLIREFDRFIEEDPTNPANETLRKLLLRRLQKNPGVLYNEMLAWLFVQQKEYNKAFAQEKAIYRRGDGDLQRIIQLTISARSQGDLATARGIIEFIIEETQSPGILIQANQLLMEMKIATASKSEYAVINKEFEKIRQEFGDSPQTIGLQLDHAEFKAFKMREPEGAITMLKELSAKNLSSFDMAKVKMLLADVLVMDEKFNQALIFYSQIQNLVKNDELSQEARFKVAKTSYYKGDFEWAQNQLEVLKGSTSQLIANDALELSLLIRDNILEDTTHTALKKYARADLLAFQERTNEAVALLDEILNQHKGEKIEDEALLKQAGLYEKLENWLGAEANYLQILQHFYNDILADNAAYRLANLYKNQLEDNEKAMEYYEQIIFNFSDSIFFVDARKNYRQLRGDAIE